MTTNGYCDNCSSGPDLELYAKIEENLYSSGQLVDNCRQLMTQSTKIWSIAPESDYKDVRANGWRTLVKLFNKFGDLVMQQIESKGLKVNDDQELVSLSRLMLSLATTAIGMKAKAVELNSTPMSSGNLVHVKDCCDDLILVSRNFTRDTIIQRRNEVETFAPAYGSYIMFYGHWSVRILGWATSQAISLITSGLVGGVTNALSVARRSQAMSSAYATNNILESGCFLFRIIDFRYWRGIPAMVMYRGLPKIVATIHVPSQRQWTIVSNGKSKVTMNEPTMTFDESTTIRCRILSDGQRKGHCDGVILFLHGGGFCVTSPEFHELYTRQWSIDIPGAPVVSVGFSLSPESKYPVALQQALDVYLWLTSGHDSVARLLDCSPRKIIVAGESSGALQTLALACVLNDLRKEYPNAGIQLPSGLLGLYGIYMLAPHFCPSYLLATIDPCASCNGLFHCGPAYYATRENAAALYENEVNEGQSTGSAGILQSTLNSVTRYAGTLTDPFGWAKRHSWVNGDAATLRRVIGTCSKLAANSYISPYLYDDFDSLADVPLTLLVGDLDPLLDHSVMLAKKWKGHVHLEVSRDAYHAALLHAPMCQASKKMQLRAIQALRDMLKVTI